MIRKKIGILTGGGDVPSLNAVIHSAVESSQQKDIELIGFIRGWQGILNEQFVSLTRTRVDPNIGGTILKSSRLNLSKVDDGAERAKNLLTKLGINGLIVIGGEDTLSNSLLLPGFPQALISKTIDNDVGVLQKDKIVNYFTLGYPTAAEKIAAFCSWQEGLRTTAYSHERIIIVESMGMHAGWLASASCLGHPDFIIIPEYPLDYDRFKDLLSLRYEQQHHAIVVISEGARWSDGSYISADTNQRDDFGHPKFLGAATVLANRLKKDFASLLNIKNVNAVNPSYLYRSGKPNHLDLTAGLQLGRTAISTLCESTSIQYPMFLTTSLKNGSLEIEAQDVSALSNIEPLHRFVPDYFYNQSEYSMTTHAISYLHKIVPEFPAVSLPLF